MSVKFQRAFYKAEARQMVREGSVSPLGFTAVYMGAVLALELLAAALSESVFVSLLTGLCATVLGGGMLLFCMGLRRREHMPFGTLLDGFGFAGRLIWLNIRMGLQLAFAYLGGILGACLLTAVIGVAAMGDAFSQLLMDYLLQLEAVQAGAAVSADMLPMLLGTMLVVLIACLPMLLVIYRLRFALYNLCTDPSLSAGECLALSRQQTRGFRWQLFVLDLSYLPWVLLCIPTLGILMIWLMPYMYTTDLGVYAFCSRENGAEVTPAPAEQSALPEE